MSWDVYIMRADAKSVSDLPDDYKPEPLGDAAGPRRSMNKQSKRPDLRLLWDPLDCFRDPSNLESFVSH